MAVSVHSVRAEHIIGGEIYYDCLGGGTYEVTMKLYRDCYSSGAAFDNPAHFGIYDESGNLVNQVPVNVDDVQWVDPGFNSPCLSVPPDICVQEGVYNFTVSLPDDDQSYQIVYTRCCRNHSIINLSNPGSQGLTLVADIPASSVASCNSSPRFNGFPPPVLCSFEYFEFDHSATDPDGDSLVYSLCSPFIGGNQINPMPVPPPAPPYSEVSWQAPYSATHPMEGDPGLSIDPHTGLLSGKPVLMGQYVVGVCVEEWSQGQLVGTHRRDFQFNVAQCEQTSAAIIKDFLPEDLCEDFTFHFTNLSDPGNEFLWDFGDPTTTSDVSTDFHGSYTYPDTGTYEVTLITNPGFFCSDTTTVLLPVYLHTVLEIVPLGFVCTDGDPYYSFEVSGEFDQENASIVWDFGGGASPGTATGTQVQGIAFDQGTHDVQVELTHDACPGWGQTQVNIPPPIEISIVEQDTTCTGLTYSFQQVNSQAVDFHWDFGVEGADGDQSTLPNPQYTYQEPGFYDVTVTGGSPLHCPVSDQATFEIQHKLEPVIEPTAVACLEGNSVGFQAGGLYSPASTFQWTFEGGSPGSSTAEHPGSIHFDTPGNKEITLTVEAPGCTREVKAIQRIHPNPVADFQVRSALPCAPARFNFTNLSITESVNVQYHWDFGDGSEGHSKHATHVYREPGVYTVGLHLQNLDGCVDEDSTVQVDVVEVFPTPLAGFSVHPNPLSPMNPEVNVTAAGEGYDEVTYFFDGREFSSPDFSHVIDDFRPQTIRQTVTNEFGCSDRTESTIRVSDHLIYVPSAFTPDEDGLNDIFRPETTGAYSVDMRIYDRWGQPVFQGDGMRGWDGSRLDNGYYAEAGVYTYVIILTDHSLFNFEYTGSVRLIR